MRNIEHRIIVSLNLAGFDGRDIDDLRPPFLSERPVRFELQWLQPPEGQERYRIFIEIDVALAAWPVLDGFLEKLCRDLHEWAENQVRTMFGRKTSARGLTEFRFQDATIALPYRPDDDRFAQGLLQLPRLLGSIGSARHKRWEIAFDRDQNDWKMVPVTLPTVAPSAPALPDELAVEFEDEMMELYRRAADECGYRATTFLNLVYSEGGVAAAKRLLRPGPLSRGLARLNELGRLDLSIEVLVTSHPQWHPLFTLDEITVARSRLEHLRRSKR